MPSNRGGVEVEGLAELRATLKAAGDDMADLKDVNAAAAKYAMEAGITLVPVDSGALLSSIRSTGTKTSGVIRAGSKAVPYANPIHWGWPDRGIIAQPFLSEGAQESEAGWVKLYEEYMQKVTNTIQGANNVTITE